MFTNLEFIAFLLVTVGAGMICRYVAMKLANRRHYSATRRKYFVVLSMWAGLYTSMFAFFFGLHPATFLLLAIFLPFTLAYMAALLWGVTAVTSAFFKRESE
jgi:hypothetical protein